VAKFILEEGEQVLDRLRVTTEGRLLPGELILTDRRVVLEVDNTPGGLALFGLLGGLLGLALRKQAVSHQIRRADFSDVELTDKDELTVRNQGEGYGLVWFTVRPVGFATARTTAAIEWSDRLRAWATVRTVA
jgi:hypothetical protein